MKKNYNIYHNGLFMCALYSFFLYNVSYAQWSSQSSGTTNTLNHVHFINNTQGWIAGENGTLLSTTNGGTNWISQSSGTLSSIFSVYFVNGTTGWLVGTNGMIRKSIDGGVNWTAQTSGVSTILNDLHFINANTGYIVGTSGTILKTIDGGTNWVAQSSGTTQDLLGVVFINVNIGFAVGNNGTFLKTTNGGTNWVSLPTGTTNALRAIDFSDANNGYIGGDGPTVLVTIDGGTNWTTQSSAIAASVYGISIPSAGVIWLAGNSTRISLSNDNGTTWQIRNTATVNWRGVHFISEYIGWVVGENGTIRRHNSSPEINLRVSGNDIASNATYTFAGVIVEQNSSNITFTIQNTSSDGGTLYLTGTPSITLSGTHSSDFSVNTAATTSPIAAGNSTTFTVRFSPTDGGTRQAQISIANNDSNENPYIINLQGTGLKLNQTITFATIPTTATFGDAPISLSASASSGLGVTLVSSNPQVAEVQGSSLIIKGTGTTTITASQTGTNLYNAATDIFQVLTVNKASQSITFAPIENKTMGDPSFLLQASSNSGLLINYRSGNPEVIDVNGNVVTIVGIGTAPIVASQEGNENYLPADEVSQTITVVAASNNPIITDMENTIPNHTITLYPNPVQNLLYIGKTGEDISQIEQINFLNLQSQTHWTPPNPIIFEQYLSAPLALDVSALPKGIYLIQITQKGKKPYTAKIIKQ